MSKTERAVLVSVRCPGAPSSADCQRFSTRALVVVALKLITVEPAKLAPALGVEARVLERARCEPDVLPLRARLTLAALIGFEPALAPLARALRGRTLRALNRTQPKTIDRGPRP